MLRLMRRQPERFVPRRSPHPGESPRPPNTDVFTAQFLAQEERPSHVEAVAATSLTSSQRGMLVHDGTLTRYLSARELEEIDVQVIDQRRVQVIDQRGAWLEVAGQQLVLRRRAVICSRTSGRLCACAESLVVLERLPQEVAASVEASVQALGSTLLSTQTESRRELLWFGLTQERPWGVAYTGRGPLLTRAYRICVRGQAAMVIVESFPQTDPLSQPQA
jgi:chorismate-pyruvate lyase